MTQDKFRDCHDTIVRTVHQVLCKRTRDVHLIDDICQDVLFICWKQETRFRELPSERFKSFVARVALNQYFSWRRKPRSLQWPVEFEGGSSDEDPAAKAEKTEQAVLLLSLLNGLPARYRAVARLHLLEGWPHKRIANGQGASINTVKTQFRRATALLAALVRRSFPV
jgi:RNA polymerase sigma factor (sigma-70 family)